MHSRTMLTLLWRPSALAVAVAFPLLLWERLVSVGLHRGEGAYVAAHALGQKSRAYRLSSGWKAECTCWQYPLEEVKEDGAVIERT